jgi:hypothetical protein
MERAELECQIRYLTNLDRVIEWIYYRTLSERYDRLVSVSFCLL